MDKEKHGMLVLVAKEDMVICIGNDIKIRAYKDRGNIKVAINAPRDIPIIRSNAKEKK